CSSPAALAIAAVVCGTTRRERRMLASMLQTRASSMPAVTFQMPPNDRLATQVTTPISTPRHPAMRARETRQARKGRYREAPESRHSGALALLRVHAGGNGRNPRRAPRGDVRILRDGRVVRQPADPG